MPGAGGGRIVEEGNVRRRRTRKGDEILTENIRVTTQLLKERQGEWMDAARQAKSAFGEAADTAGKLEDCFFGQAIGGLKADFLTAESEGEKAFALLCRHLEKAGMIAEVYEEAERRNTGVIADN